MKPPPPPPVRPAPLHRHFIAAAVVVVVVVALAGFRRISRAGRHGVYYQTSSVRFVN